MDRKPPCKPTYAELLKIVSQPYASQIARGRRKPSLEMATKIEAKTGYPAGAWYSQG